MPTWTQWLSLVIACIGAATGGITFWRAFTRETPRLRVHAYWAAERRVKGTTDVATITSRRTESVADYPDGQIVIAAINVGYVAVYVEQVGLCPDRRYWHQAFREYKDPVKKLNLVSDADEIITLPYKLEPGQKVALKFSTFSSRSKSIGNVGMAYVMTADDRLFTGGRKMVRAFAKQSVVAN